MKHQRALGARSKVSVRSRSNWNLEMLVFVERGKPENPEKNPRSRDENQQQTQPTYDAESGNRTRATLVGGECSQHCAIPATPRVGCGCDSHAFRTSCVACYCGFTHSRILSLILREKKATTLQRTCTIF